MFGAAKADLEPQIVDRCTKKPARVVGRDVRRIKRNARQQRVEQCGLAWLERVSLATTEEGALRLWLVVIHLSSCPALGRASASFAVIPRVKQDVDGRDKPGHDEHSTRET